MFMFLVIFMLAVKAGSDSADDAFEANKIKMWSDEDEEMFEMMGSEGKGRIHVNVNAFGAVGDGVADDTQAFLNAWVKGCSTSNAVFLVPHKGRYKVNATRFKGPCHNKFTIQIEGTIIAPEEPENWDPKNPRIWLHFSKLEGVRIKGGGTIDGSGTKWWAASCKINTTNPCKGAPTALTIDSSSNILVKGLIIQNAQQMHLTISRSAVVKVSGVHIWSPEESPNTDGIHITESTGVVLHTCDIETGDDCISIVNGSSNIRMKNIYCGPGHGISIGSLGKDNTTAVVSDIVLDTATIKGTTNGLRIKTWQGGSGYVKSVLFKNVEMIDVENPIIIDQFYCDSDTLCNNQTSAVKISEVVYKNIFGTSRTLHAMKFLCSDTVPCSDIILKNIRLESMCGTAETYCNCAIGLDYGVVRPPADCLKQSTCDAAAKGTLLMETEYYPIHTEL